MFAGQRSASGHSDELDTQSSLGIATRSGQEKESSQLIDNERGQEVAQFGQTKKLSDVNTATKTNVKRDTDNATIVESCFQRLFACAIVPSINFPSSMEVYLLECIFDIGYFLMASPTSNIESNLSPSRTSPVL
jgi:hypothetical protein